LLAEDCPERQSANRRCGPAGRQPAPGRQDSL